MKIRKNAAIILAGGKGKRMHTRVPKQYLELQGYPVLYYTIKAFEDSFIDEIILVAGKDELQYCKEQIVEKYNFQKVKKIVSGGKERYHSVYEGLKALTSDTDIVYIHDGARPFVEQEVLERVKREMETSDACVVGMPVKDTIKLINKDRQITESPDRSLVWQAQTPQAFALPLIIDAFEKQMKEDCSHITDDAMVVEKQLGLPVYMVEGSYRNIKITTQEDLVIAQALLKA